jgi:endonuclease YncB( thermonuclease family)
MPRFILAILALLPTLAAAEELSPCLRGETRPLAAARVLDGRSFVTADQAEARLATLEVPDGPQGDTSREALARLIAGRALLGAVAPGPDRYGRLIVTGLSLAPEPGAAAAGATVEQTMLTAGHARVAGVIADKECRNRLITSERTARAARTGLWSDPNFKVFQAHEGDVLAAEQGRFTVVEGRVVSVREAGATVYVNFGRRWSRDFSVTISKRSERRFAAAGVEPRKLEGRRLRVRGYIEMRGGASIDIVDPSQIEIVEGDRS